MKTKKSLNTPKQVNKNRGTAEKSPKLHESTQPVVNTKSTEALIYITGESPLVEQYAELCAAHGFNVYVSWNQPPAKKPEFQSSCIQISKTIPASTSAAIELTNIDLVNKKTNLQWLDTALPDTAPILSSSVTVTATEQALWILRTHRLIGIAALPTLIDKPLVEIAPTIYSPKETIEAVLHFFHAVGKEIEIVQDRVGMVFPRILCQVINEAVFAVSEEIAAPQDIDNAMKLGLHFPLGPIEWAERIGLKQVYAVLNALYTDLQEDRYRTAPLLKHLAITGDWWRHEKS